MTDQTTPSATLWKPRAWSIGPLLFGVTRAISGEWTLNGVPRRLCVVRGANGWHRHLIIGPWCLSVGRI